MVGGHAIESSNPSYRVMFESVSESITLVKHVDLEYTPMISNRIVRLEEIGGLVGMSSEPTPYPEVYIEQYRSKADKFAAQWLQNLGQLIRSIECEYEKELNQLM